jgi:hypothetical protein
MQNNNRQRTSRQQPIPRFRGQRLFTGIFLIAITVTAATLLGHSQAAQAVQETLAPVVTTDGTASNLSSVDVSQSNQAQLQSQAVRRFVESEYGPESYVGPCENAESPRDLWMRCTRLIADEESRVAFLAGRTFSEFDRWIIVQRSADGSWKVTSAPGFDFASGAATVPWS